MARTCPMCGAGFEPIPESVASTRTCPKCGTVIAFDGVDQDQRTSALRLVRPPAVGLITIGAYQTLLGCPGPGALAVEATALMLAHAAVLFSGVFVIASGLRMRQLRSRRLALCACFVVMLPPMTLLGLPVGAWSLFVLTRPSVREAFRPAA